LAAAPKATTSLRFTQLLHILFRMPLLPRPDAVLPFTAKLAKSIHVPHPPLLVALPPLRRSCPSSIFLPQFLEVVTTVLAGPFAFQLEFTLPGWVRGVSWPLAFAASPLAACPIPTVAANGPAGTEIGAVSGLLQPALRAGLR
jgi:hypothetical protein